MKDAIKDIHKACIDGGAAEDLELPTKPLTYASLIAQLKSLGLIPSTADVPSVSGAGAGADGAMDRVEEQQQQKLLDDHHKEVLGLF